MFLKGFGIADELGLIEDVVYLLHDLVAHLDAHADVDGARLVLHAVLGAYLLQPVRAAAAGGDNSVLGIELKVLVAVVEVDAAADVAVHDEVGALGVEEHLDAVLHQPVLDGEVDVVRLLGAQVADGAVHKLQAGLDGAGAYLAHLLVVADALNVLVRAELEVDLVGVVYGLLGQALAYERGQVAADVAAQAELAVGERAGAGKAGGYVADGLAVHAHAGLGLGAAAASELAALFDHDYLLLGAAAEHLQRRENTSGARADNDDISVHINLQT